MPKKQASGRPRSAETTRAILEAASGLLEESGLSGFTIEAVAARSGAAKTTIYRWWPSRGALAIAGLLAGTVPKIAYRESRSVTDTLIDQVARVADVYSGKTGRIIAAIIAEGQADEETLAAFVAGYVRPRRAEAALLIRRAIENGEIREDTDIEMLVDALYGPIYYRLLVPHAPMNAEWIARLSHHVLSPALSNRA